MALALGRAQPAADLSSDVYGDPFVRTWTAPVTPPEVVIGAGKKLAVRVRFIVDGTGRVTAARVLRSPDSALNEAALVAIRSWTFTPALDAGKPVPTCLDVPIVFFGSGVKRNSRDLNPPVLPEVVALTAAEPDFFPPGDYPTILTERKISGSVTFRCQVAANGRVSDPRITSATHVDFVLPGLAALTQWRFKPAHRGDLMLDSEVQGQIDFSGLGGSRMDVLAANGITAPDGTAPTDTPEPYVVADPVFPYAALIKGEGGVVTAAFTVDGGGAVSDIKIVAASNPEEGAAVAAALAVWHFQPAMQNGQGVVVPLLIHQAFKAVPLGLDGSLADPLLRIVRAARNGQIGSARGLDAPLKPIYRVAPVYPAQIPEASRVAGEATIDIVVDRDGLVRLPRVVAASRPEFGWAAMTALAQWVFQPPMRHGTQVDVNVRIPVKFAAPN